MPSYVLFTSFKAQPGRREGLLSILAEAAERMRGYPGCDEYRVFRDAREPDVIHVLERWADEASHKGSLADPAVKEAIARAMPLLAGVLSQHVLAPA